MLRVALAIFASLLLGAGLTWQGPEEPAPWRHAAGDRAEGSQPAAKAMPADAATITLPHRVMAPNTPLWYWRPMSLPAGSALLVDADDGAQVFIDGVRADHYRRWFFVPEAAAPVRQIAIRVMNHAMQGGLRVVRVVPAADVMRDLTEWPVLPTGLAPVESQSFQSRMPAAEQPCRFSAWAESQGGWPTFSRLVSWFAWSCGSARFVALDMNTEFPLGVSASSQQHEWLMNEVRSPAWSGAAWRILLVHQPPWSRSWAGYDGDEAVRAYGS